MEKLNKHHQLIKTDRSRYIHGLGVAALAILGFGAAPAASAQSYTLTTLATFNGNNGAAPKGDLTLSGNTLYGTTSGDNSNADGTVFSVPTTGGTPTVLATFNKTINNLNGDASRPVAGLTLIGSTLYGGTLNGGTYGNGTVFSVPTTGGGPTVLTSFNGTNGGYIQGDLLQIGSTFYGLAGSGGTVLNQVGYGYGELFSVPITGGVPTLLASFSPTVGAGPVGGLTLIGNKFYGATFYGGANNAGTVFSVPVTGGTPTVLASFSGPNGNGADVNGSLILIGSTLYGTTGAGGVNDEGTVFSLPVIGGTPTTLASFNGPNGSEPFAGLTHIGNTLFGTTYSGGAYDDGEVFSLPITGGTPTVLASFNGVDGSEPVASLIVSGGTLYGTTQGNSISSFGTVFSLTPVPEASSVISLALLLALGMGGMVIAMKRTSGQGKAQD